MSSQPLVSILIPAYKADFFQEALESAINQSYSNIEILIGDDSQDSAIADVLMGLPSKPASLRYQRNPWPYEGNGRRNHLTLISDAKGQYLKFLNDDDVLMPDCVEKLVAAFSACPEATLAVSRRRLIDDSGATLADKEFNIPPMDGDFVIEGPSLSKALLETYINFVGEPTTVLFRKRDVLDISPDLFSFGGHPIQCIGDIALWINLGLKGNIVYQEEPLSCFRLHGAQRIHTPGLIKLANQSIKLMRDAWTEHHLDHSHCPAGHLLVRRFPCSDDDWQLLDIGKYGVRHRFDIATEDAGRSYAPPSFSQPANATPPDREKYDLAVAALAAGDKTASFEILSALAESGTSLWEVYNDLGALAVQQGDLESAQTLFEMASTRENPPGDARLHLAQALQLQDKFMEALETLSPLLRAHPDHTAAILMVRQLLGVLPELPPVAWARLLVDLRSLPQEDIRRTLEQTQVLEQKSIKLAEENRRLHEQVRSLQATVSELAKISAAGNHAATWEAIHALPENRWLDILIHSTNKPSYRGFPLPGFPPDDLQVMTVGSSNESALREGFKFYRAVKDICSKHGMDLRPGMRLLDFGTGWGRYARIFLKDFRPENVVGVDVDSTFIETCRKTFPYCRFDTVPAFPPTALPAATFDLIIAYSVFSHLSEEAATAWIKEFARVLKPGGMIAVTTQGRSFLDYCASLRKSERFDHPWHKHLARSFVDLPACKAAYDQGKFLFSPTGSGEIRPSTFYGEALIPPDFVEKHWATILDPLEFIDDRKLLPQALIVMRKRTG